MITKTSYDAVGERAYHEDSMRDAVACTLIGEVDQHLEAHAPWAHRIDDYSDIYDSVEEVQLYDEPAISCLVRVRAPRGTWSEDGDRIYLGLFDGYVYEAEDNPEVFIVSVHRR